MQGDAQSDPRLESYLFLERTLRPHMLNNTQALARVSAIEGCAP
jgi:hypothetical protein